MVKLIIKGGIAISVKVNKFCFAIKDSCIQENLVQRTEAQSKNELPEYDDALDLALWAWEHDCYDSIEECV